MTWQHDWFEARRKKIKEGGETESPPTPRRTGARDGGRTQRVWMGEGTSWEQDSVLQHTPHGDNCSV